MRFWATIHITKRIQMFIFSQGDSEDLQQKPYEEAVQNQNRSL